MNSIRIMLDSALTDLDPVRALNRLASCGALNSLPEILDIIDLGDGDGLHKDVWTHTLNVVSGVPNTLELRWAALLHDIGKARTRRVDRGKVTFHGHDVVGARIARKMEDRVHLFGFRDFRLFNTIQQLIIDHLRPASYGPDWGDSGVRRLLAPGGGYFEKLMFLSRADLTTKRPDKRRKAVANSLALEEHVKRVRELDSRPKLPKHTMGIILEKSGQAAGPWLNELKDELENMLCLGTLAVGLTPEEYAVIAMSYIGANRGDP